MSQENPSTAAERPDRVITPAGAGASQNAYYTYYGTSFSAPVVSGTVALMLEANKSLTPALVKASLVRTASALPASLFPSRAANVLTQAAGEVNAVAARSRIVGSAPGAPLPWISRTPATLPSSEPSAETAGACWSWDAST